MCDISEVRYQNEMMFIVVDIIVLLSCFIWLFTYVQSRWRKLSLLTQLSCSYLCGLICLLVSKIMHESMDAFY